MTIDIRPIERAEFEAFSRAQSVSFGRDFNAAHLPNREQVFEYDRSLAAFDGSELVATAGTFTYRMAVPGGELPTAGVTMVSVKPTHRRRGILTELMRRQLFDIHERGEPMAALWASESAIYGRFGYGPAAEFHELRVKRVRTALRATTAAAGTVRFIEQAEAREQWPTVWEGVRANQPGMMTRAPAWWNVRVFMDNPEWRDGFTAQQLVNYENNGDVKGYLRYRTKAQWEDGVPSGIVRVEELMATTDEAYQALWEFVFGIDLIGTIEASLRTADEPLYYMLADPRHLRRTPADSLWLRPLDVAGALAGRRYAMAGRLILRVEDQFLGLATGTYTLVADEDSAECTRSGETTPDVVLSAAELGAVYLGATRFATLARAGRVRGDDAALRRADAMFGWNVAPWCPEIF